MIAEDAKKAIQEMVEYSQKWHNRTSRGRSTETSDGLATIQAPEQSRKRDQEEEGKTLEEACYTQFGGPFQGGGYRATAPGYYQRNNANPSYQERRQSMEDTLSKFIRNQGASIKTLKIQIGQMSKALQERGFENLPSSTETNPRDQVKSIQPPLKLIHTLYAVLDLPNTTYLLDRTEHCCKVKTNDGSLSKSFG
ncbi:hypothetical protein Tco_1279385 [Tanacetum coccineum]